MASSWSSGPALIFTLASMQSLWALGACVTGALVGGRDWVRGAVAGGCFGLLAIAAFYVGLGEGSGWDAAHRHLTTAGGGFWISAAILGGMAMGANGVVLTRWPTGRLLDPSALAHAALSGVLACEAAFVVLSHDDFSFFGRVREVCVLLLVLAAAIAFRSVLRSGPLATLVAFLVAAICAPVAAGAFLLVEHHFGYVTV